MSEDVPDPLAALRAQDARPVIDRWREHLTDFEPARLATSRTLAILGGVLVALIVVRSLASDDPPPLEAVVPMASSATTVAVSPPSVAEVVVVHVAGEVDRPGLVQGLGSWRVADAIAAAGGATAEADLDLLNLAALVTDGERVYVPAEGESVVPAVGSSEPTQSSGPIDLNRASTSELDTLPGVGPATAAAIVAHREQHGPFVDVDALVAVRGIGQAKLEALRDHLVVR